MSRVYVGHLPYDARERDVEKFFDGYGRIREIMMKKGFCFVEFEDSRDAEDAVKDLDNRSMLGTKVYVEHAKGKPRTGGGDRGSRDGRSRACYNCNREGHFARDCREPRRDGGGRSGGGGGGGGGSRRRSRSRSFSPRRSKSRSQSPRRSRSPVRRSDSRSPDRRD